MPLSFKCLLAKYELIPAAVEPASRLQALEVTSKSMRLTWAAPMGELSRYQLKMIPMMPGTKQQELYVGPSQTSVVVKSLSPDTEYQISLFALSGLMASEPVAIMQKTVKVSMGEQPDRSVRRQYSASSSLTLNHKVCSCV